MQDESEQPTLIKLLALPLGVFTIFLVVAIAYKYLGLPDENTILEFAKKNFGEHGYLIVLGAAFVEGLLFVNWYFPGSVVAVVGVALSRQVGLNPAVVILMIIISFFFASIINYFLGRYGWYRLLLKLGLEKPLERARERTANKGLKIIFATYVHPNLGALTATSAGILRMPLKRFVIYSAIATVIWNTAWGAAVYFVGQSFLKFFSNWTIVVALGLYIIWKIIRHYRHKKSALNL